MPARTIVPDPQTADLEAAKQAFEETSERMNRYLERSETLGMFFNPYDFRELSQAYKAARDAYMTLLGAEPPKRRPIFADYDPRPIHDPKAYARGAGVD